MKELLTVKDVAEALGLSTNTVYKYLNSGAIRASRAQLKSGRFRIPKKAVEEFVGMPLDQLSPTLPNATEPILPQVEPADQPLPPPTPPAESEYMHVLESLLSPTNEETSQKKHSSSSPPIQEEIIHHAPNQPPSFTIKTARVLLALGLGMLALNLLFFTVPEPLTLFTLLIVFFLFLLLSYQYGGMQRRS
jgi:excisionase family DNA binding protein